MGSFPQRHALSTLWGVLPDAEYDQLVASVRQQGLADPVITLFEGEVLDGWHRVNAAVEAGRADELVYQEFTGDDPIAYVIARNARRRHLTVAQRAGIVVACYEWRPHGLQPGLQRDEQGRIVTAAQPDPSNDGSGAPTQDRQLDDMETDSPMTGDLMGQMAHQVAEAPAHRTATTREMAQEADVSERAIKRAKAARREAEAGAGPSEDKPKPPTRTERLEAQVTALQIEVDQKAARIEELEEENRFLRAEHSEWDHEREAAFHRQRAIINSTRSEFHTERGRHNDLKASHQGALKRLRALEAG